MLILFETNEKRLYYEKYVLCGLGNDNQIKENVGIFDSYKIRGHLLNYKIMYRMRHCIKHLPNIVS